MRIALVRTTQVGFPPEMNEQECSAEPFQFLISRRFERILVGAPWFGAERSGGFFA